MVCPVFPMKIILNTIPKAGREHNQIKPDNITMPYTLLIHKDADKVLLLLCHKALKGALQRLPLKGVLRKIGLKMLIYSV